MSDFEGSRGIRSFARDIAVIILGVLIALGVDGFVAERADRALEDRYLERLVRDLRADSVAVGEFEEQAAAGEQAALDLLSLLQDPAKTATDTVMSYYFGNATRDAYLKPNAPTIEELLSTGNLRVITDDGTRDAVLSYYAAVTRFQRMLETVMGRGKDPLGDVGWDIQAFDPLIRHAAVSDSGPPDATPSGSRRGTLLRRFRQHPAAERATRRAITYNRMLQSVLRLWQESLASTTARVSERTSGTGRDVGQSDQTSSPSS